MRDDGAVRRRRVFYLPGFDPHPPRRYRELYRREARRQAAIAGYCIDVMAAEAAAGWRVDYRDPDGAAHTEIEVLDWSDVARGAMRRGLLGTYLALFRTAWIYLSTGTLWPLAGIRRGPVLVALYPVVLLLAALASALGVGAVSAMALWSFVPQPVAALAGLNLTLGALALFRAFDSRHFALYLMNDYAFLAEGRGRMPAALDARIEGFATRIAEALESGVDEVLVVGHSTGAQLAVSALARVAVRPAAIGPALGLLTLGQSIPMVALLPRADALRADLRRVAARLDLTWIDVSAPSDACAFALSDPVATCTEGGAAGRGPLVVSAAFNDRLGPERLRALRFRFFRRHFQYLCAFDDPAPYDYFAITAGPRSLAARFEGRRPSASAVGVHGLRHAKVAA